jgi:hypothetical protein
MLRLVRCLIAIGLLSQSIYGCGQWPIKGDNSFSKSTSDGKGSDSKTDDVAVLYFGGFNSCSQVADQGYPDNLEPITPSWDNYGMSMVRWIQEFGNAYSRPHRTLIACYPFWTNLPRDGIKASSSSESQTSEKPSPRHVDVMDAFIYIRHNLAGSTIPTKKIRLQELLLSLETQLASQNITRVAVLGHSYGGYTAMLVAKALSTAGSRLKVTSLTTLDPISMDTCQPQNIIDALQQNAKPLGCNQAPSIGLKDNYISPADIKRLAANIPWTNIWQGADIYLHSSPIAFPGVDNLEVVYNKDKPHGVANHVMFLYPKAKTNPTWPKVAEGVIQKVAKSLE